MKKYDRYTGSPVSRAVVWAIDVSLIDNDATTAEDYAVIVESCGIFLGFTNRAITFTTSSERPAGTSWLRSSTATYRASPG